MYLLIDVSSNVNRDANGKYIVDLCNCDTYLTVGDLAEFLEIKDYEITIVKIFKSYNPDDECLSYPTIYVTDDDIFFS